MDIDALRTKWLEQDRKLDGSLLLKKELKAAIEMNQAHWPLQRFTYLLALGAGLNLIGLVMVGQFLYAHWAEPRFAAPAGALHLWLIASLVASVRQIVTASQIEYDKPVAGIQKQIESLRGLRIRLTQWALLTGQLVWWIPFMIVGLKGFWNLDAYKIFGSAFLMCNLAFGLAVIPLAIWASRRFGGRMLAGYNVNEAADFLATLSE